MFIEINIAHAYIGGYLYPDDSDSTVLFRLLPIRLSYQQLFPFQLHLCLEKKIRQSKYLLRPLKNLTCRNIFCEMDKSFFLAAFKTQDFKISAVIDDKNITMSNLRCFMA